MQHAYPASRPKSRQPQRSTGPRGLATLSAEDLWPDLDAQAVAQGLSLADAALHYCRRSRVRELKQAYLAYRKASLCTSINPFWRPVSRTVIELIVSYAFAKGREDIDQRHLRAIASVRGEFVSLIAAGSLTLRGVQEKPNLQSDDRQISARWATTLEIDWDDSSVRVGKETVFVGVRCFPCQVPAASAVEGRPYPATQISCCLDYRRGIVQFDSGPIIRGANAALLFALIGNGGDRPYVDVEVLARRLKVDLQTIAKRVCRLRELLDGGFAAEHQCPFPVRDIIQSGKKAYRFNPDVATRVTSDGEAPE